MDTDQRAQRLRGVIEQQTEGWSAEQRQGLARVLLQVTHDLRNALSAAPLDAHLAAAMVQRLREQPADEASLVELDKSVGRMREGAADATKLLRMLAEWSVEANQT